MNDGAAGTLAHFLEIDVAGGAGLAAAARPIVADNAVMPLYVDGYVLVGATF
jgi:hypothetical protein